MADNWYWFQFSLRYGKKSQVSKKCENSVLCENIQIQFGKIIFSFEWQLCDIVTAPLCFKKIITIDILIWKCRKKTFKQKVESAGIISNIITWFCPSQFVDGRYLLIHTSWFITDNIGSRHKLRWAQWQTTVSILTWFLTIWYGRIDVLVLFLIFHYKGSPVCILNWWKSSWYFSSLSNDDDTP